MNVTYLGLVAGALTSVATIPQVIKSHRTRHVQDISIWQPLLLSLGTGLWLIYGFLIGDVPLVVANVFSVICNSLLIWMKIAFADNDKLAVGDYIDRNVASREEI